MVRTRKQNRERSDMTFTYTEYIYLRCKPNVDRLFFLSDLMLSAFINAYFLQQKNWKHLYKT